MLQGYTHRMCLPSKTQYLPFSGHTGVCCIVGIKEEYPMILGFCSIQVSLVLYVKSPIP